MYVYILLLYHTVIFHIIICRKENNERMPASEREMMEMQAEDVRIRALYKDRYIELHYYYLLLYYFLYCVYVMTTYIVSSIVTTKSFTSSYVLICYL